ncbi:type IX secretion system membrane protein PorP/SprF [Flavobacterium branchiarum]|uniref:Type IX secretion system membrane protein PorP/SprF n=1 Tax=Flavobacterium branchiarum TaxID=1114870 RepID=A0ABV5FS30_9FLAO|nr:type IX secretion system membrane protein PorP/SprF [Flavobacterium branchiarum]MDN3673453.1 type IX secretion system membrane protein PorP/SprF [Flavobacterium branchiarum]
MKKTIILLLLLTVYFPSFAQQDSQYTQYMYNTLTINPGYTGTSGVTNILGIYRAQWVGLDGAPKTANLSIQGPVSSNGQGLGFTVINDQIGATSETTAAINYSYPITLSEDVKLSLGLSAVGNFWDIDYNKLTIQNQNDIDLAGKLSKFSPNIGAGVFMYSDKWYVGVSIPKILETEFYDDIQTSMVTRKKHFYMMGGYVFTLSDAVKFKPAAMIKAVVGSPLGVDLSANFLLEEKFTLGVAYRWDAAVSAMAGFQVSEGLNIGYAYDFDTSKLGRYNSGSHEVFLRFDLLSLAKSRIITPRFF